jgi:hypothetical protein
MIDKSWVDVRERERFLNLDFEVQMNIAMNQP